jgi:hypothetical protein
MRVGDEASERESAEEPMVASIYKLKRESQGRPRYPSPIPIDDMEEIRRPEIKTAVPGRIAVVFITLSPSLSVMLPTLRVIG